MAFALKIYVDVDSGQLVFGPRDRSAPLFQPRTYGEITPVKVFPLTANPSTGRFTVNSQPPYKGITLGDGALITLAAGPAMQAWTNAFTLAEGPTAKPVQALPFALGHPPADVAGAFDIPSGNQVDIDVDLSDVTSGNYVLTLGAGGATLAHGILGGPTFVHTLSGALTYSTVALDSSWSLDQVIAAVRAAWGNPYAANYFAPDDAWTYPQIPVHWEIRQTPNGYRLTGTMPQYITFTYSHLVIRSVSMDRVGLSWLPSYDGVLHWNTIPMLALVGGEDAAPETTVNTNLEIEISGIGSDVRCWAPISIRRGSIASGAAIPLDDVSTIAGFENAFLSFIAGHWVSRTVAQVKAALAIVAADIGDFVAAARAAVTWATLTGKPATFAPSAHAATHAAAGTDPVALDASQVTSGVFALARIPPIEPASHYGNTIEVDKHSDNATDLRTGAAANIYDRLRPFATLQAAYAAMADWDTIIVRNAGKGLTEYNFGTDILAITKPGTIICDAGVRINASMRNHFNTATDTKRLTIIGGNWRNNSYAVITAPTGGLGGAWQSIQFIGCSFGVVGGAKTVVMDSGALGEANIGAVFHKCTFHECIFGRSVDGEATTVSNYPIFLYFTDCRFYWSQIFSFYGFPRGAEYHIWMIRPRIYNESFYAVITPHANANYITAGYEVGLYIEDGVYISKFPNSGGGSNRDLIGPDTAYGGIGSFPVYIAGKFLCRAQNTVLTGVTFTGDANIVTQDHLKYGAIAPNGTTVDPEPFARA